MGLSNPPWCKICGLTRIQDVTQTVGCGANAIGLNFYPHSPRYIDVQAAQQLSAESVKVDADCQKVGLFVNPTASEVNDVIAQVPLDMLQFSGEESAEFCRSFGMPYLKAVKMQQGTQLQTYELEYSDAWALLLDTHDPNQAGGTGQVFDWGLWPKRSAKRLILAGGLSPENVASAVQQLAPFGVDVSSGVEGDDKGIKDSGRVRRFIQEAKNGGSN